MKKRTLSLAISAALLLTACGGGGSTGNGGNNNGNNNSNTIGLVGDGYIEGAYVCHDSNNDLSCLDEGTNNYTTTIADGSFDSNNIANYDATQNLLVEVPIGAQDNGPYVDTTAVGPRIVNSPVWFILPAGSSNVFASPFSTLIFSVMQSDPSLTLAEAEDLVKARLGLAGISVSLFDDYLSGSTQNSDLHVLAEIITSALLENMGDLQSDSSLSQSDRLWYATQFIFQNLGNLVTSLPDPLPANFDASNHDSSIRFSQTSTEFASQLDSIGGQGDVVVVDACTTLTDGLYAFEHWRDYTATTADDAFIDTSEIKTMKLDANNEVHVKSEDYDSAGAIANVAWDSRTSTTLNGYIIDINNLATARTPWYFMPIFGATKTNCQANRASFTGLGNLIQFDMYLTAQDISNQNVVDLYPDFEKELNHTSLNPVIFPTGSLKMAAQVHFTADAYTLIDEDDGFSQIRYTSNGSPINSATWANVSGNTFYFGQGRYELVISGNGTIIGDAILTNYDDNSVKNGKWQLEGSGGNEFLQTDISMDDDGAPQELFIAKVIDASNNATLRAGEYNPAGTTLFLGNPIEDIMDDIMFNKTAHDLIFNTINVTADTDGDGTPNATDTDDDNDGLSDVDELAAGTDTLNPDSDYDGLNDGDEVHTHFTNPTSADTDGDGLTDYDEVITHLTDPNLVDTDTDGLSDYDELNGSPATDPLNNDTDGDGLNDGDEATAGSNPLLTDTDFDGLSDSYEVANSGGVLSPTTVDSDGDGVADGLEVTVGTDPEVSDQTDSDNDGIGDAVEVHYGWNPNVSNSSNDSDGDTLSNYDEINTTHTNPLMPDTDGDSANDNVDNYPLNPNLQ